MTRICSIIALLVFTSLTWMPRGFAQDGATEGPYVRFKRPNLVVPDMDAALRFYVDMLGFKLVSMEESKIDPNNYAYTAFNFDRSKPVRQATLDSSTEARAFAITEVKGLAAEISRTPSLTAMVVETKRFMALVEELKSAGYAVTEFRDTSVETGRGILEVGVLDPAGHLIVVYQYVGGEP